MKKICQWLCPKQKKNQAPYDVHEQTFQMDENFGDIGYAEKHSSQPSDAAVETNHKLQQIESLDSEANRLQKQQALQSEQKKFSQSKNKIEQQPSQAQLNNQSHSEKQPISSPLPVQQKKMPEQPVEQKPKPKYNILPTTFKKKKINLQDFYFKKQENQFKVKTIGSINGQQFNIDGCKNGKYFIFDVTANIYIDDCQDCFIYAAPVESSIFVRSCKNMVIVGAFGQFRTYDCHNCHFSIYCKSQPVIESSSNINFSSIKCPEYSQLRQQFEKVGLHPWNNNWSQIHNFTKKQGQVHYYLHKEPIYQLPVDWQHAFTQAKLQMTNASQQIVPFIQGALPLQTPPSRKIVVFNSQVSKQDQKIFNWIKKHGLHILRASKTKLNGQKYFTVALMVNYQNDLNELDLEQVGSPTIIQDVESNEGKYFVGFKDEREG